VSLDLLIVGGGPAGLGAAVEAAGHGLSVMLMDENAAPGGRIWQALEARGAKDADEAAALALIGRFRASSVRALWNAAVWAMEPDGQVFWSDAEGAHSISARNVLLATGTIERPMPIPGWTLPGVMTVGGRCRIFAAAWRGDGGWRRRGCGGSRRSMCVRRVRMGRQCGGLRSGRARDGNRLMRTCCFCMTE
jgi:NADPH-dependent 2,4-dienoyl-CoA reductase/sulfur reductase-like enzyme